MTSDVVLFISADLQIIDGNASALECLGYSRDELRGLPLHELLLDDPQARLQEAVVHWRRGEPLDLTVTVMLRNAAGETRPVDVRLQGARTASEQLLVAVVTSHRTAALDSSACESSDYLTRLPSRGVLETRLLSVEQKARTLRGRYAVLFIDIDRFKHVNDTRGHRTGDQVLRTLGQRLKECVRPCDFVARYGGDEFVVLIEEVCEEGEVEGIAERIRAAMNDPIHVGGSPLQISVSVGMAIGHGASSSERLLDEADRAMYRMKQSKRLNRLDSEHCQMRMERTSDTVSRAH